MDKIKLSMSSHREDFIRLHSQVGFTGEEAALTFPETDSFNLFFSSFRAYQVKVVGDAVLDETQGEQKRYMQFFSVNWSDESKSKGSGNAELLIINPEKPDLPNIIRLTLGEFSYLHLQPTVDQKEQ